MKIITFSSIKGGVGKTTLTFNYGEWLSSKGYNVLLIDSDHQCSLTQTYDIYKDHGLRLYEDRKPPHGEARGHKRAAHRPRYCPRRLCFLRALRAHTRNGDASRLL